VNYVSQGSSYGRQSFISGAVDFGASDIPFQSQFGEVSALQSQRCAGQALQSCFAYVPTSAAGVAFMYNLLDPGTGQRITTLELTRREACKIFTGAITRWNDPELVATNPQLAGDFASIVPIIRSDGAGESLVFSQFCIAETPDIWDAFIADREAHDPSNVAPDFAAGHPVSDWPQGWGRSDPVAYGDGVANAVADPIAGQNAITYTADGYAKVRSLPVASVQNAAGAFTQPTATNVTAGLRTAVPQNDPSTNTVGTFTLDFNDTDPQAYFPATYSYVIAPTGGFDPAKGSTLGEFLCYAVTTGQQMASLLAYAPLSSQLVHIAEDSIARIPGAPDAATCDAGGLGPGANLPEFPAPIAAVGAALAVGGSAILWRRRRLHHQLA
jgi:ABC-type phosphate transport system substrate-binding protein